MSYYVDNNNFDLKVEEMILRITFTQERQKPSTIRNKKLLILNGSIPFTLELLFALEWFGQ